MIGCFLVEGFSIGCQVDHLIITRIFLQTFNRIHQWLDHQHHACAAAKGVIIYLCSCIGGVIS